MVESTSIDVTKPIKFKAEGTPGRLNIILGKNGVGKSFYMKCVWALQTSIIMLHRKEEVDWNKFGITESEMVEDQEILQFLWDFTLRDNDLTGSLGLKSDDGSFINLSFKDGKIQDGEYELPVKSPAPTIYLSSRTRTFDQIEILHRMHQALGEPEIYFQLPIYDITFVKSITSFCSRPRVLPNLEKFKLDKLDGYSSIIFTDGAFYLQGEDKKSLPAASLSAGEQSIIVLHLGAGMSE